MREPIHTLRCGFLRLQGTQSKWIRSRWASILRLIHACAPLIDGLGHATLSATVSVCRSRTQSFQQNRHFIFLAHVPLKLLVSPISRLVACSARIVVDRHYSNPRCACAPRVNDINAWSQGVLAINYCFIMKSTKVKTLSDGRYR